MKAPIGAVRRRLRDSRKQWRGDEFYVVDKAHKRVYHLDLNERSHPCDCHCTKWEKMPSIHVMRVLHWLEEYWRVWEYVGDETDTRRFSLPVGM